MRMLKKHLWELGMVCIYEFPVMPFGLCNVSLTFTTLMNSIFHEKLDEFIIIYIDDILLYSKMVKKHMEHLEYVFDKLRKNKLITIRAKSEFAQEETNFLEHIVLREGVRPDPKKLEKANHSQRNSILPRLGQLLLKIHKIVFTDGETTFEPSKKGVVF
jgi:hypothetical protein